MKTINPISKIKANNRRIDELDRIRNERMAALVESVAWQVAKDTGLENIGQALTEAKQAIRHAKEQAK